MKSGRVKHNARWQRAVLWAAVSTLSLGTWADDLKDNRGWGSYGGVPGGGRYSALDQINRTNVDSLEVAWTYHSGDLPEYESELGPSSLQVTPILANGLLYICTPFNRVIALKPETGEEIWAFDPHGTLVEPERRLRPCRGVAYWEAETDTRTATCAKRVFKGDRAGRVFAIDANTGKPCEDFGHGGYVDLADFEHHGIGTPSLSSPPVILKDMVIVGGGVGDNVRANAPDGAVRAFDVRSGEQRWSFTMVPESMRDVTGGADVWPPFTVDVEANRVFVPTGSPSPDSYGGNRTAEMPYANALLVLDGDTGEPIWHRQLVHHDVFDYDLPAQPTLVEIRRGEEVVDAVAQITKMGLLFVFERDLGEPVFPIEEVPVPQSDIPEERTAPTQPRPVLPEAIAMRHLKEEDVWGLTFWDRGKCRDSFRALRYEGPYTPPSAQGSLLFPGPGGGGNWGGVAYDPNSNTLIVKSQNIGFIFQLAPFDSEVEKNSFQHSALSRPMIGTPYRVNGFRWLSPWGVPCSPPPWGELMAFDLTTGKTRWRIPLGQVSFGPFDWFTTPRAWGSPGTGGPMVTAGGLVFIASSMDGRFRSFDVNTGKELWRTELPAPAMTVPMTYTAGPDDRQFVVIAAGGDGRFGTRLNDAIVAFTLPQP